ncbi:hypothetical protein RclHR1_03400003 [Rhizophagus clarus]|uniref:Bromo domain-containing protein n=1 Tax=Rhizophagus clarus TaxID=94130 RepID=A0A2Z6RRA3_9GLOM|nr:hypothetical protein RclHR1_03400003 [Rhizophagus clarus]GES97536.1 hypothetical protein GLOIN_2v1886582 [Rhizophagus clarus]
MNTPESYSGQNALISYITKRQNKASYCGFLNSHRDIIITSIASLSFLGWEDLDNLWIDHFLCEVKDFPGLNDKITTEHSRYAKTLEIFWQELINEYKENKIPAANSKTIKKTKKNINTIDFCYDVLHELENKFNVNSFYKLTNKIIESSMDLFTINSKLDNNQYTNIKEFERDIRLMFRNCYIYNNRGSKIHCLGKELELIFNEIWIEKIINQGEELRRIQDNDIINSFTSKTEILTEKNITQAEQKLELKRVRDDDIDLSINESVLQAIVESLLPRKYRIPELSLVMDGKKQKGSCRFGYSDIFVVKDIGDDNNISLELKYVSLVNLIKSTKDNYGANDLENLDKFLEKEDEKLLLKRLYSYWSKEQNITKQITIGEMLENGINQLRSYMNIIAKGKPSDY